MRVIETPTKRLLTVSETSKYLGRSIAAIRKLQWRGELPFIRTDRRIFFDIFDLDNWIQKNKTRCVL